MVPYRRHFPNASYIRYCAYWSDSSITVAVEIIQISQILNYAWMLHQWMCRPISVYKFTCVWFKRVFFSVILILHHNIASYRITDNMFLCGPGTRFDQRSRICQARDLVDCSLSASLYYLNSHFQLPSPGNGDTYVYKEDAMCWWTDFKCPELDCEFQASFTLRLFDDLSYSFKSPLKM